MLWRPDFDAGFERWWKAYPRRQGGKLAAEAAYQRALKRATPEELYGGLERYTAHLPEPPYVLLPVHWLERGCWMDEYDEPAPAVPKTDWYEDCQRMHGGTCGGQLRHHNQTAIDAMKAREKKANAG